MIVTQAFNVVQNSINQITNINAINNDDDDDDNLLSIVRSSEDVDFFDSNLKDLFDKNSHIIIVGRHIYYRDVFIFIDRLKNLKKSFSRFKIKKYVVDCMKEKDLR